MESLSEGLLHSQSITQRKKSSQQASFLDFRIQIENKFNQSYANSLFVMPRRLDEEFSLDDLDSPRAEEAEYVYRFDLYLEQNSSP